MTEYQKKMLEKHLILIHTSVKLVTAGRDLASPKKQHFNPHEREARDHAAALLYVVDVILIHTSVKLVTRGVQLGWRRTLYFNPHEREARDIVGFIIVTIIFIF